MVATETSRATVLVVDDELELVSLYETFLEPEYDVRTATSGNEALEVCDEAVDVVLLDQQMPDMSGDEVLAELRQRNVDARVAMLTGSEPDQDIIKMPFDDYRIKPIDRRDLLSLVDILIKRATYNERSQELFSLVSQKAALEVSNKDVTGEYEQIVERMQKLRTELDTLLDDLCPTATVKDLETYQSDALE